MPVLHSRGGDDRRKASSYRRAFGGQPSFSASRDSKGSIHTFASPLKNYTLLSLHHFPLRTFPKRERATIYSLVVRSFLLVVR